MRENKNDWSDEDNCRMNGKICGIKDMGNWIRLKKVTSARLFWS
jgi:hypothetical protein